MCRVGGCQGGAVPSSRGFDALSASPVVAKECRRMHACLSVSIANATQRLVAAFCHHVALVCRLPAAHMVQQGRAAVHASTEHAHVLYLHHVQSLPHVVHHVVQFGVRCVVHVDVLVRVSCRRRRDAESVSCRALQRARRKALSMSSARAWRRQLSRATRVHYPMSPPDYLVPLCDPTRCACAPTLRSAGRSRLRNLVRHVTCTCTCTAARTHKQ